MEAQSLSLLCDMSCCIRLPQSCVLRHAHDIPVAGKNEVIFLKLSFSSHYPHTFRQLNHTLVFTFYSLIAKR